MLSQTEIAQLLGITPQHLSTVVSGRSDASKDLAIKLAKKTGSEPAIWVFGKTGERKEALNRLKHGVRQ